MFGVWRSICCRPRHPLPIYYPQAELLAAPHTHSERIHSAFLRKQWNSPFSDNTSKQIGNTKAHFYYQFYTSTIFFPMFVNIHIFHFTSGMVVLVTYVRYFSSMHQRVNVKWILVTDSPRHTCLTD